MIRLATEADIPRILKIYGPYVTDTAISFEYTVPTLPEFTQRFHNITADFPWLVWEENRKVLGYAYGSLPFSRAAYRWCASAYIYLDPAARGRGIGKKLYAALEALLQAQGYRKIYAVITSSNPASRIFHEKMGYRFVAEFPECGYKFGKFYGVIWMEKPLNTGKAPQNFPISVHELVNIDRFFL